MALQTIWFFLWGLLWAVFFMTDGFDFGVGTLMPFLGKNDEEKTEILHSMGPFWDGNEVWLITAGGVTFAAFPLVYAVMFSSMYSALLLILFALIFRGVAIEFRNKSDNPKWKGFWEMFVFFGSVLPAILFGVAFANIFKGIPIDGEHLYRGTFFTLINYYGLLGGVFFLLLFLHHGALWLTMKTDGVVKERTIGAANKIWYYLLVAAVLFLIVSWYETKLFVNYLKQPAYFIVPVIAVIALIAAKVLLLKKDFLKAWIASAVTIVGCTFFGVIGIFPSLFPSSIDAAHSLTAYNASSSPLTLKIMLGVVVVFVPLVIAYQAWAYKVFHEKIDDSDLAGGQY